MAPPVTPTQSVMAFHFSGGALRYPAVCTLGSLVPTAGWADLTLQADVAQAAADFHQLVAIPGVFLDRIEVKVGPSASGPTETIPVTVTGETGLEGLTSNTAYLIRKNVTGVSQRFGGRMFWPGIPEGFAYDDGKIEENAHLQVRGRVGDFFNALVAAGVRPVILSGSSDTREITGFTLGAYAATQRRRMRR